MVALLVLLLLVLLSIHIGIVLSRSLMGVLFVALDITSMRAQALAPSAPPVATATPALAETGVVRLAA